MGKRLVSTIGVLSFFIYTAAAQERVLSIDELFQLADQNSKSIQLHSLAIDETTQAVDCLPSGHRWTLITLVTVA